VLLRSAAHPLSFYAATKKSNELMAHSYAHLYRIPTTGLRFFTVYGAWGRPDMALFKFVRQDSRRRADRNLQRRSSHARDFTYIDDIVEGMVRVADRIPEGNPDWPDRPDRAPHWRRTSSTTSATTAQSRSLLLHS